MLIKKNQPMRKFVILLLCLITLITHAQDVPDSIVRMHEYLTETVNYHADNKAQIDPESELNYDLKMLQKYFNGVTEYYRYYQGEKKIIKGVRVYTDNDLFAGFDNRDHEYTGGLRVEVITDYVGTKLLSFRPDNEYLSYQSVFFGFEAFTPDVLDVDSMSALNPLDRPFASFQYFGRSRNILKFNGKYRASGTLKVGIMGGDFGRNFQRLIHRDVTDSENNNGWDFQIANGGRFALQYDLDNEWQFILNKESLRRQYLNLGFTTRVGFIRNSIAPTLTFTNKSFFQKNPHYALKTKNEHFGTQSVWKQFVETVFYEVKFQGEAVAYNAMLQGYIRDNEEFVFNEETNLNFEIPTIDDINNFVGQFSLGFGFRTYRTTILFDYVFMSPEYDYSWKDKSFHRYGRISFTMNL